MTGTAHKNGRCGECVKRKVRCDKTRPACWVCVRRNQYCPGYPTGHPFHNTFNTWDSEASHRNVMFPREYDREVPNTPMDSQAVPNLVAQADYSQTIGHLAHWKAGHFSGFSNCYGWLVDPTWLMYGQNLGHPHLAFLRSAICALDTFDLARAGNAQLKTEGLKIYTDAVVSLRLMIGCVPLTDDHIATMMMFAFCEMMIGDPSLVDWVGLADGIRERMETLTAKASTSGFGFTLLITLRPFLIRAAFAQGQPCFLEQKEWVSIVQNRMKSRSRSDWGDTFEKLNEDAYMEVVKVPGLAARTYSLCDVWELCDVWDDIGLHEATVKCRDALRELEESISHIKMVIGDRRINKDTKEKYLGAIRLQSANNIVQGSLQGIQSTLALLEDLLHHQSDYDLFRQLYVFNGGDMASRFSVVPNYHTREEFCTELRAAYDARPDVGWLDVGALSMGAAPTRDKRVFPWRVEEDGGQDDMVVTDHTIPMGYDGDQHPLGEHRTYAMEPSLPLSRIQTSHNSYGDPPVVSLGSDYPSNARIPYFPGWVTVME